MELDIYWDKYTQECLKKTQKEAPLILGLSLLTILMFTFTDYSYFGRHFYFWRGVGIFFTLVSFTISLVPPFKSRINSNYVYTAAFAGILFMMEGIFIKILFVESNPWDQKMAVTLGIIMVYVILSFFSLGAKKEFKVITLISLIPIAIATIIYTPNYTYGHLSTFLFTNITAALFLHRHHKHSFEKFIFREKLETKERALLQKTKELERINEELRSFNHSISHDFKTPIRAANSFSQLLARDVNQKNYIKVDEYVDFISGSMQKMNSLLEALNMLSNIAEKKIRFSRIDTSALIHEAFESALFECPRKCDFSVAEDLPLITGDKPLLRQVFTNLFSNALKYNKFQSSIKIKVGYYQEGDETVIFIRDNGIGFNMEFKDQMFKMFKRLHTPEEYGGTGIGLAIVKRIMGYHQGEVWASSEQGKGATFFLAFPSFVLNTEEKAAA